MSRYQPRAAAGHIPFVGHRTQKTIRLQREGLERRLGRPALRQMAEFGVDIDTLGKTLCPGQ